MSEPLKLVVKSPADEIRADVLDILREQLARAEAGEIDSVLVVFKYPDGHWGHRHSGVVGFSEAIGQIETIKQDWIDAYRNQ